MPIEHGIQIKLLSDEDFHALDYEVMGLAFAIHNEMGRFWSEPIYQNELANRCRKAGFAQVATEVPIRVSYQDFNKCYFADLLINNSVIYELKAVRAFTEEHQNQALNYLFLLGMQRGKLINLRPLSVQSRFVSTRITPEKRYHFAIEDQEWRELDGDSLWLKQLLVNLLNDWGAFLDIYLFYDAIYHFRGGQEKVVTEIKVMNGANFLGTQKVHLLNSDTAFNISSITKANSAYEEHLRRFLNYTSFKAIQWINFNHDQILFKTLLK
jgi:GxxExxY protein